jgi:hypothetical protein
MRLMKYPPPASAAPVAVMASTGDPVPVATGPVVPSSTVAKATGATIRISTEDKSTIAVANHEFFIHNPHFAYRRDNNMSNQR